MGNYNYRKALKHDIREYIGDNYTIDELAEIARYSIDDLFDKLLDELWLEDSVTGNGSGSYTFNRYEAREYVTDNLSLCVEACEKFDVDINTLGKKVSNEDWEYLDVTIRCYLLNECLNDVLVELEPDIEEYFNKEEVVQWSNLNYQRNTV